MEKKQSEGKIPVYVPPKVLRLSDTLHGNGCVDFSCHTGSSADMECDGHGSGASVGCLYHGSGAAMTCDCHGSCAGKDGYGGWGYGGGGYDGGHGSGGHGGGSGHGHW